MRILILNGHRPESKGEGEGGGGGDIYLQRVYVTCCVFLKLQAINFHFACNI
jgi:hypothetical protein